MAASGQVIERMAKATGLLPSTIDRTLRPLREAGLVPMGEKGRGQAKGHYEPVHLANLFIALAGHQPSDAADTVKIFIDMEHTATDPGGWVARPRTTLGDNLASIIDRVGRRIHTTIGRPPLDGAELTAEMWRPDVPQYVVLSQPLPCSGLIIWAGARRDFYMPVDSHTSGGGLSRQTTLNHFPLLAAAELWADTFDRRGNLDLPSPTFGGGATSPEKSETPEPRHRVPASLSNNRPRKPKAGQSDSSENNSARAFTQVRLGARGLPKKDTPNDEVRN
jgi:hypothetical protein